MAQGSVLDPLLFLLCTSGLFSILENKLIGYAHDCTLMAVVPSPGVRVTVAESLIRSLGRVSEWCDFFGNKVECEYDQDYDSLQALTMHPLSPPLTLVGLY